jgi:ABC-type polysaccharide/polyol phosphate export permease
MNVPANEMTEDTPLMESFRIHLRVIGALLMREILDRYGRHNIGFLWFFFEPMMFTLAVTALWTVAGLDQSSQLPIVAFALSGYSAVLLWRNMPSRCVRAVQANHTLMHHRNIKIIDIYLARLLLEGAGATTSFTILTIFFASIGWMNFPENPLNVTGRRTQRKGGSCPHYLAPPGVHPLSAFRCGFFCRRVASRVPKRHPSFTHGSRRGIAP